MKNATIVRHAHYSILALGALLSWGVAFGADAKADVAINEVLYDAVGSDTGNEWLELVSIGGETVELAGWKIQKAGASFQTVFTFPAGARLEAGKLLLVGEQNVSGAAFSKTLAFLNAGGRTDGIRLLAADGAVADVLLYGEPNVNGLPDASGEPGTSFAPDSPEGTALARKPGTGPGGGSGSDFAVTSSPTPGGENAFTQGVSAASPSPTSASTSTQNVQVVVNEMLPNPEGADAEGEFLELKNLGDSADLGGWSVDDAEGGSTPYVLPSGFALPKGGLRVLRRAETGLAFNNDADRARLLNPGGQLAFELVYDRVPGEGQSLARRPDGSAAWTTTPTPGQENVFTAPAATSPTSPGARATASPSPTPQKTASPSAAKSSTPGAVRGTSLSAQPSAAVREDRGTSSRRYSSSTRAAGTEEEERDDAERTVPLAELRALELGTVVRTDGVVSAAPGMLDARLLYLAGSGMGVVLPDGTFPVLVVGDRVEVAGRLAQPGKERFITLASADMIKKVDSGPSPEPHNTRTGEVSEQLEGSLVLVRGNIVSVDKNVAVLDDGSGPLRIFMGHTQNWTLPALTAGGQLTATGVVSENDEGYRLLPRTPEDLRVDAENSGARSLSRKTLLRALAALLVLGAIALLVIKTTGRNRLRETTLP